MDFDELQNTLDDLDLGIKPTKSRAGEMMHGDHEETRLMGDYHAPIDRERLVTKIGKRLFYDLKDVKNATEHIGQLPGPEETIHIIMPGNYAAFDLTLALANLIGEPIQLLTISTLGYNKSNFTHLLRMLDGGMIDKLQILGSEVFAEKDTPVSNYSKMKARQTDRLRVAFNRNHSKIQIYDLPGRNYVVETSSNLRSCSAIEQATITRSTSLADFHRNWISKLIDQQSKWKPSKQTD